MGGISSFLPALLLGEGSSSDSQTLASVLPLLLLSGSMGTEGGASSSVMMAMLLALSSERGKEQLSQLGGALLSGAESNAGALSSVSAAYSASQRVSAYKNGSDPSSSAASAARGVAGKAISAQDAARFNAASSMISNAGNRSADTYRKVIDQFDVENNPRYAPRNGSTYCNIFQWDVTKAMGAEIPHYTNAVTGDPTTSSDPDVRYMNANRISDWLNTKGEEYGWYEVSAQQAQQLANQGHPAVTIWKNNGGGHGHCQVVCPSESGGYDTQKGVTIAQAGRRLMNYSYITNVYSSTLNEVQYFAHK